MARTPFADTTTQHVFTRNRETGTDTEVDHVRLFRNHPQLRYSYRVHEQILPGVKQLGSDIRWTDIVIHHVGYQDPALRARPALERRLAPGGRSEGRRVDYRGSQRRRPNYLPLRGMGSRPRHSYNAPGLGFPLLTMLGGADR